MSRVRIPSPAPLLGEGQRAASEARFVRAEPAEGLAGRKGGASGATGDKGLRARRDSLPTSERRDNAHVAQSVERVLGKDEVTSSILVVGSRRSFEEVRGRRCRKRSSSGPSRT